MGTLTITKNYEDGDILFEADLDEIKNDTETFVNTTKLNSDNIQTGGVSTTNIADSGITTVKINDAAVTESKLADGAVTGIKLGDLTSSNQIALIAQVFG